MSGAPEGGPREGEVVEAGVDRLAYGGDGVARVDGFVLFVPWTAPGDRVRATVTERNPTWARARLDEVLEPGPRRVEPGCPVFGTCGGCQLQHLDPVAQRDAKARAVSDAFERIADRPLADAPVCEAAATPWHYRDRVVLSWRLEEELPVVGFHAAHDPDAIVEVPACPIFAERGNRAIAPLVRGLGSGLGALARSPGEPGPPSRGRLAVRVLPDEILQAGVFAEDCAGAREIAGACAAEAGVPATWGRWDSDRGTLELSGSAPRLETSFEYRGRPLRVGFDSFLQADLESATVLYDAVLEALDPREGDRIVDGYAGVGITACDLLERGARVTAVEAHPGAASDLRANTARVDEERAHVLELPADRIDWGRPRPAAVVLNPPRAGVPRRALASIHRSSARRIVYVSCDPTTLARDVRRLGPEWKILATRAFDLFPQTSHVEAVMVLERERAR
ncbi:MAG: TRAM domain-containing protein [Gemmatimonadota bacterium]|nr:TRAM domain-containing protein [Gemmatimonadota bacterium]